MDKISTKKMMTLEALLKTADYVKQPHGIPHWYLRFNEGSFHLIDNLPVIDKKDIFKNFPATYWDDNEGVEGFITFYEIYLPSEDDNIHHLLPEEIETAKTLSQLGEAVENYKMRENKLLIARRDRQRKEKEAATLVKEEDKLALIASDYQYLFCLMSEDDTFDSAFYKASRRGYETNFDDYTATVELVGRIIDPYGGIKPLFPKEQLKPILKEMTILYNLLSYIARVKKEETDLDDDIGDCLQEWEDFVDEFIK